MKKIAAILLLAFVFVALPFVSLYFQTPSLRVALTLLCATYVVVGLIVGAIFLAVRWLD